jgi:quercetin dioxygenase-like cupin family protein
MTLNYEQYMERVLSGDFPENPIIPLPNTPFIDGRGIIQNLFLHRADSITYITSKRGTVRANHFHSDWHVSFLVSGLISYYAREVGSKEIPEPTIINPGMMFISPPNKEHSMLFLEDSVFITFQNSVRTHENHENSVHRVDFINPKDFGFK